MDMQIDKEQGVTVLTPALRRLDAQAAPAFREQVVQLVEGGERRLVIDLAQVGFIDSSGLGALVSILKAVGSQGALAVCGAAGPVQALFRLTRMDKVFVLLPTRAEAVARLA